MNKPLIILERFTSDFDPNRTGFCGCETYTIAHKGEKVICHDANRVQSYILDNFNIHLREMDIQTIPFNYPVTVDSIIDTNKQFYSFL